jgi:hypothetical protein
MAAAYHQGRFTPEVLDWLQFLPLIGPTNDAVAQYEGVLRITYAHQIGLWIEIAAKLRHKGFCFAKVRDKPGAGNADRS